MPPEEALKSKVFSDRRFLDPAFMPEVLRHREKQRVELMTYLSPALTGSPPGGTALYGYPGTGKTSVVMRLVSELEERTKNFIHPLKAIYLNCNLVTSMSQVLQHILATWGDALSQPGLSNAVLSERLRRKMEGERWVYLVIIDEADRLGKELDGVVYELTEMNTRMGTARIALMTISNHLSFLSVLEERSKSRYEPKSIYFAPYSTEELTDILTDRADKALRPGVLDREALVLCAAYASKDRGDARKAIDLLRTAGVIAEVRDSQRIDRDAVSAAAGKVDQADLQDVLKTLPDHPRILLKALVKDAQVRKVPAWPSTGDVYMLYKAECVEEQETERTLRQLNTYLRDLESLGLLVLEVKHYGQGGITTAVHLGVQPSDLVGPLGLA